MKPAIASRVYILRGRAYCVCSECAGILEDEVRINQRPYKIDGPLDREELTGMPCQIRDLVEIIEDDSIRAKAKGAFSIFGSDRS